MNSFLKTVHSMTNRRKLIVKQSLQKQLNTCVMEMQRAPGAEADGTVGNYDKSMTLCSVLEAIFLHGLKDSLLNRVTEVLSGPDIDAVPQPSFWGPLLVFSHRQIIDQIQTLSQLITEVGYCRAWIRLALNEGLLASYLCSIRSDNSALKPYYNHYAFVRDMDCIEVAERLIESLDYIRFDFVCNSSLLNFWSHTPLLLAGIWSPPMKSCPVFSAVDIAKTISTDSTDNENLNEVEIASSIGSSGPFNSSQSALNNVASIMDDEALKTILANKESNNIGTEYLTNDSRDIPPLEEAKEQNLQEVDEQNLQEVVEQNVEEAMEEKIEETLKQNIHDSEEIDKEILHGSSSRNNIETNIIPDIEDSVIDNIVQNHETSHDTTATTVGNSLIRGLGWSTLLEDCESSLSSFVISHDSETDPPCTPGDGPTYDSIIHSYHNAGNISVPDLQEFLKRCPKKQTNNVGTKVQSENKV